MATDKPRFSVTFTNDSFDKILRYQKEHNISTQSKAVAQLVELAIKEIEAEIAREADLSTTKPISEAEQGPLRSTLLYNFDQLNQEGQERLVETSDDMVASGKYIKSNKNRLGKAKKA